MNAFFTQGFVVQNKTRALPEQAFDSVAMTITKNVENAAEWIVSELMLNDQAQAAITFTKINRVSVQVDCWYLCGRPQVMLDHDLLICWIMRAMLCSSTP